VSEPFRNGDLALEDSIFGMGDRHSSDGCIYLPMTSACVKEEGHELPHGLGGNLRSSIWRLSAEPLSM